HRLSEWDRGQDASPHRVERRHERVGHRGCERQHCRGEPSGPRRQPRVRPDQGCALANCWYNGSSYVNTRYFTRRGVLKGLLAVVAAAFLLPYDWGPIYPFPEPVAFIGQHIWNPYAEGK